MNKETLVWGKYMVTRPGDEGAPVLSDAAVFVRDGRVKEVGPYHSLRAKYPNARVIGDGTHLVMPGLVDAHSHCRGLAPWRAGIPYGQLEPWLHEVGFYPSLPPRLGALYSALKHIRSGFTCLHYLPIPRYPLEEQERAMQEAAEALVSSGLRIAFSVPVKDRNYVTYDDQAFISSLPGRLRERLLRTLPKPGASFIDEFVDLAASFARSYRGDRFRVMLGPVGPQWCSEQLLMAVADLAERLDTRIHMHTLQTPLQRAWGYRQHKDGLISYLADLGLLGPRLTLGHAVWLSERDIERMGENGVSVTHHAGCNLNMRNGIAPVDALLARGVTVAMGLDDKPFDEQEDGFQEMKLILLLHRVNDHRLGAGCIDEYAVLRMATESGAEVLDYAGQCGRLEPDCFADMILLDPAPLLQPWLAPEVDIRTALLYAGNAELVRTVLVGGEVVMEDGRVVTFDEEALEAEVREHLQQVRRDPEAERLWAELREHFLRFYSNWELPSGRPFYLFNSRE